VIRAVVFDVGETLLDDTAEWGAWADWIGVSRHTFSTVLGAVTATGRDNAEVFQYFRPGFDLTRERQRREQAGHGERITDADLYPDVRDTLARLRSSGLWVGVAGNQTTRAGQTVACTGPAGRCRRDLSRVAGREAVTCVLRAGRGHGGLRAG
jgi:phosphoglycolate phosphatase-like HAD superfamily hydrolase